MMMNDEEEEDVFYMLYYVMVVAGARDVSCLSVCLIVCQKADGEMLTAAGCLDNLLVRVTEQ